MEHRHAGRERTGDENTRWEKRDLEGGKKEKEREGKGREREGERDKLMVAMACLRFLDDGELSESVLRDGTQESSFQGLDSSGDVELFHESFLSLLSVDLVAVERD